MKILFGEERGPKMHSNLHRLASRARPGLKPDPGQHFPDRDTQRDVPRR